MNPAATTSPVVTAQPAIARARARRARRRQRGVALILVLASLTILTVMLTEFQSETSAELASATAERDAVKAEYAARSGLNLTRLLIAAEPTIRNRFLMTMPIAAAMYGGPIPQIPVWKFAGQVLGAFNGKAGQAAFQGLAGVNLDEGKNLGLEGAHFEVDPVDEDAKTNINLAARGNLMSNQNLAKELMGVMMSPQYDPLFEQRDPDGQFSDRLTVCSAIIDWADPDDKTFPCDPTNPTAQSTAVEDSFYQMLKSPYPRKNAGYDSLQELRLVRGISDDFWATFVEPDPDDPDSRVMTVWGAGKINVNTAPPQVLWAQLCAYADPNVPQPVCQDPEQMMLFMMGLGMVKNFLSGMPIFGNANTFIKFAQGQGMLGPMIFPALGIEPLVIRQTGPLKERLGVESKVFSIYSTGVVKAGKRETRVRIHAVVDYRKAPPPGMARNPLDAADAVGDMTGMGTTVRSALMDDLQVPDGADPDNWISGSYAPNPAGNIIYYRVD